MDAQQLQQLMTSDSDWLLIDVRPRVQYMLGHIPHAHNLWRPAYEADEWEYPIKGMRASQQKMTQLLSRFGVKPETKVILYDEHDNADSARLWWIMRLYGHKNTALLNGGLMGWKQSGFHTSLKVPGAPAPSQYSFNKNNAAPELLADLSDIKSVLTNQDVVILDVRNKAEATGQQRRSGVQRKGRIPHSLWLEFTNTMDDDGFLNKQQLETIFTEKGIQRNQTVIIYCHSGVRSANTLFVLKELLGYPNVRNYDGSWIEWSNTKELPITSGIIK